MKTDPFRDWVTREYDEATAESYSKNESEGLTIDDKLKLLDAIILQRTPKSRDPFIPTRFNSNVRGNYTPPK
jgi:hypothetical protein